MNDIICPHCGAADSGEVANMRRCNHCNQYFGAPDVERVTRKSNTRRMANVLSGISAILFLLAVAIIFFSILGLKGGEGGGDGFSSAAILGGLSLWVFLIAQVIHIRANTEK